MKTKWVILETERKLKEHGQLVDLVDIFDTRNSPNGDNWEWVAWKVRRADAERIIAAVNGDAEVQKQAA